MHPSPLPEMKPRFGRFRAIWGLSPRPTAAFQQKPLKQSATTLWDQILCLQITQTQTRIGLGEKGSHCPQTISLDRGDHKWQPAPRGFSVLRKNMKFYLEAGTHPHHTHPVTRRNTWVFHQSSVTQIVGPQRRPPNNGHRLPAGLLH